jgi:hypothetical protein
MKRLALVAAAVLLAGCSGNYAPSTQTVRNTTSISTSGAGEGTSTATIESYSDVGSSTHRVGAAPDRVWELLPAVYRGLGITVGTSLPDSRTIGNIKLELNRVLGGQALSNYVNCGEGATGTPLADSYRVNMSILTTLTPTPNGGTQLGTRINASAVNRAVSGAVVNCASTGRLEGMIAERIKSQTNS